MGNKCCSKRQDDITLTYPTGYNPKNDGSFTSGQKITNGGSIDSRYTPDPNRGQLKPVKGGVDIIRPRIACKYNLQFNYFISITVQSN